MLCDPVPGPTYKREILKSVALHEESQSVLDMIWLAFQAGYYENRYGEDNPRVNFRRWLSQETGLDLEQILICWENNDD